jgi:hypothetical protein
MAEARSDGELDAIARYPFRILDLLDTVVLVKATAASAAGIGRAYIDGGRMRASIHFDRSEFEKIQRRYRPGHIAETTSLVSLEAIDGTWACARAAQLTVSPSSEASGSRASDVIYALYSEVPVPTAAGYQKPSYFRWIFSGNIGESGWLSDSRPFIRAVLNWDEKLGAITVAAESRPSRELRDSLWVMMCLLNGHFVQSLCEELYSSDGVLLSQCHQLGEVATDGNLSPFLDTLPSAIQLSGLQTAIMEMKRVDFRIERILGHLLQPDTFYMDHEALHLILAIHAAHAEWRKYWKARAASDPVAAKKRELQRKSGLNVDDGTFEHLLTQLEPCLSATFAASGTSSDLATAVRLGIANAKFSSMADSLNYFLREEMDIEITENELRALAYRNPLVHDGGFREDIDDLQYEQVDEVYGDLGRLRNIANEVVLKLCGFGGQTHDYAPPRGQRTIRPIATPFSMAIGE